MPKKSIAGEGVSFFFPAYFDEKSLPGLVRDFYAELAKSGRDFEVIIVEDRSPDKTAEVADALAGELPKVRAMHNRHNMGYGGALTIGFSAARKDWVGFTDGDGQYSAADLRKFLDKIDAGEADIIIGYRTNRAEGLRRTVIQNGYKLALLLLFGMRFRDPDCGFKMMRSELFAGIMPVSKGGFFSAELLINAKKKRLRIMEVPVRHLQRRYGKSTFLGWGKVMDVVRDMLGKRFG